MSSFKSMLPLLCGLSLSLASLNAAAMKCDIDEDADIDRADIAEIFKARGQTASGPDDPRDSDNNLVINIVDGRICQSQCTQPKCQEPVQQETHSGYVLHINVQDADTSKISINAPINLGFSGPEVVDENVKTVSNLSIANTLSQATLYLKEVPQQGQDVKITAGAPGYFDTGTSVILSPDQRTYRIDVMLVKAENGQIAPGIEVSTLPIGEAVEDGTLMEEVVATNETPPGSPNIKVTLPAGVVMTDNEGNPVNGVSLNIASFDPYHPEALEAYPGGLDVIAQATGFVIDGVEQVGETEINFKSAGFVAINIEDENGNKVKHFSEDIEVAMQFKVGTKDATGKFVLVGDEVPIWSYDEDTGIWSYEKVGIVQDLDVFDGMFDVVYSINHLTYFNLDWHLGDKCTSSEFAILDTNGVPLPPEQVAELELRMSIDSSPRIDRWISIYGSSANLISFINAPRGFPGSLRFYDKTRISLMGEVSFTDICADVHPRYEVTVDSLDTLSFEKAMELIDSLLARPLVFKQQGTTFISAQVQAISTLASYLLATGDDNGPVLLEALSNLIRIYAEAFLDNVDTLYEERLLAHLPFIDGGAAFGGLSGYGCLHPDLSDLVRNIQSEYATYSQFGGTGSYAIGDMILRFIERAAREFISFSPDSLAYTAEGVGGFVRCGYELHASLQIFGYAGGVLGSDIQDHFEPVVLANVQKMRDDVEQELIFGIYDLPPTGKISLSTANTFDFILQDAMEVANVLAPTGRFSSNGIAQIRNKSTTCKNSETQEKWSLSFLSSLLFVF